MSSTSSQLGRPQPESHFSEPVVLAGSVALKRRWRWNRWSDVDGPLMRVWDVWDGLVEVCMSGAKLLLRTVVGPVWGILCEAALRDEPRRGAINVKPTLSGDATFVLVYIGDHNCICADLGALLENTKGEK